MNLIHEAYVHWRSQYKILLRTFSEEQMFGFGFEAANKVNEVMQQVRKAIILNIRVNQWYRTLIILCLHSNIMHHPHLLHHQ